MIRIMELHIIRFMKIHKSIHGALQFAVMELQTICGDLIIHMMKLHNIHRPTMELHDWNVDVVS